MGLRRCGALVWQELEGRWYNDAFLHFSSVVRTNAGTGAQLLGQRGTQRCAFRKAGAHPKLAQQQPPPPALTSHKRHSPPADAAARLVGAYRPSSLRRFHRLHHHQGTGSMQGGVCLVLCVKHRSHNQLRRREREGGVVQTHGGHADKPRGVQQAARRRQRHLGHSGVPCRAGVWHLVPTERGLRGCTGRGWGKWGRGGWMGCASACSPITDAAHEHGNPAAVVVSVRETWRRKGVQARTGHRSAEG